MKSTLLWTLAVLNVVLLIAFIARITPDNSVHAQAQMQGQAVRRTSDYVMIPGLISGGTSTSAVYIVDETAGQLAAIAYDERRGMEVMAPIDLQGTGAAAPANTGTGTGSRTGTGTQRRGY